MNIHICNQYQQVEKNGYSQYSSELEITKDEFINKMQMKYSDFQIEFKENECIKILEYTTGGRIKTIKIGNHNLSGVEVRTIFGLKSANFTIEISNENVKFKVTRIWAWSRNESNRS